MFFNSCLKALFFLEIFIFLFRLFGYVEKRIYKKTMVNFKTSQNEQQIIAILSDIPRSKGNKIPQP